MGNDIQYLDLVSLLGAVKQVVADAFEVPVWVKAEISSWSPRANGHCYLTLSQSRGGKVIAETRAMIWSWKYLQICGFFESSTGERLREGITVLVQVKVNYSELYGVSLYVEGIDPAFTLGEKALERKRIIERLEKGGFMEFQKELAIPEIPRTMAVITSRTAAGYQDFMNHIHSSGYAFDIQLFEAAMQGSSAPASIMEALEDAAAGTPDAILILRGGGSELDLSCFDDEELAIAIARCPVPVVTAIGHDKDVHIADMVACTAVKTPTALADLFIDLLRAQDDTLDAIRSRIRTALDSKLSEMELRLHKGITGIHIALEHRVSALESALLRSSGRIRSGLYGKYNALDRHISGVVHRLQFAAGSRIGEEISRVTLKDAIISASDPRKILSLGYVLVSGKDNKILKSVGRVAVGDQLGIRFSDGSLIAKVDEIFSEQSDNKNINIA